MGRSFGTKSSSSLEGGKTMSMMNYLKLTSMIIKRKSLSLTGKQEIFTTFQVSNWWSFAKIVVSCVAFFLTHKNNNLGQIQSNPDYYVGSSKSAMHCLIYQAFHKVTNELLRFAVWNKLQNLMSMAFPIVIRLLKYQFVTFNNQSSINLELNCLQKERKQKEQNSSSSSCVILAFVASYYPSKISFLQNSFLLLQLATATFNFILLRMQFFLLSECVANSDCASHSVVNCWFSGTKN